MQYIYILPIALVCLLQAALKKAKDEAKETFKELKEAKVDTCHMSSQIICAPGRADRYIYIYIYMYIYI